MNLSSIVNGILAQISSSDDYAMSKYDIDSKKELDELGAFLNGNKGTLTDYSINELKEEDKNLLKQIYNSLKEKLNKVDTSLTQEDRYKLTFPQYYKQKEYLESINKINSSNLFNVDNDIIDKMFNNDLITKQDKKEIFSHISNLFINKAIEMNIPAEDIKRFQQNIKKSKTPEDYNKVLRELFKFIKYEGREEYAIQKELEKIKNNTLNYDTRNELQKYAEEYWYENNGNVGKRIIGSFGIGYNHADGDMFKQREKENFATTQETGNCWAMAGVNSMKTQENSKTYMNSQIYKDSMHGLYVVQLAEAKNYGFGKDGKGVYIITDTELYNTANISDGDLDIAAYNLAIKKYLIESGERKPEEDSLIGNTAQRLYEISQGMKAEEINDKIPVGVGFYNAYFENMDNSYEKKSDDEISKLYDKLLEHFNNGGQITLGVETNIDKHLLHAISVVGIKDGKFIVQESNNNEEYAKSFQNSWKDESNTWNILLDKDNFIKILHSVATNS